MNFISGGYYFSQGKEPPEWTNTVLLPKTIWSVSEVFSEIFPNTWAFTLGNGPDEEEKKFLMDQLGLNENEFLEMQKFLDDLYFKERCGFPYIIYDLSTARLIYQQYLFRWQNLKLLGLGLPTTYFNEFLEETTSPSQYLKSDLRYQVLKREAPASGGHILGFDILGYSGGFWSFISQGFETAFSQELGVHLNAYGLIDNFDDAARALAYVKAHDPEEGVWCFWQVMEYLPVTPQ